MRTQCSNKVATTTSTGLSWSWQTVASMTHMGVAIKPLAGASFNLPDLRGRVLAGRDNMGGVLANRLAPITKEGNVTLDGIYLAMSVDGISNLLLVWKSKGRAFLRGLGFQRFTT